MSEQVRINPVTLDIVKDSLIAVSNEIFYAFAQTSMSPIIYETLDYASGIADAEGRLNVALEMEGDASGYELVTSLTALKDGRVMTDLAAMGADCGIMITASHNPAGDNGIKIFAADGFKLPDEVEFAIEAAITAGGDGVTVDRIGKAYRLDDARGRYIEFAKGSIRNLSLRGLKIVLDCANGAAYSIAPPIFRELGAEVIETAVHPNGLNINDNCGALHPENIGRLVREHGADCGIALDGDADRVIFCDADDIADVRA